MLNFWTTFFGHEIFASNIFFLTHDFFWHTIFSDRNFFWGLKLFWPNMFLYPKLFSGQIFLLNQHLFGPPFGTEIFFLTQFFSKSRSKYSEKDCSTNLPLRTLNGLYIYNTFLGGGIKAIIETWSYHLSWKWIYCRYWKVSILPLTGFNNEQWKFPQILHLQISTKY